jgi:hypothetical protein
MSVLGCILALLAILYFLEAHVLYTLGLVMISDTLLLLSMAYALIPLAYILLLLNGMGYHAVSVLFIKIPSTDSPINPRVVSNPLPSTDPPRVVSNTLPSTDLAVVP